MSGSAFAQSTASKCNRLSARRREGKKYISWEGEWEREKSKKESVFCCLVNHSADCGYICYAVIRLLDCRQEGLKTHTFCILVNHGHHNTSLSLLLQPACTYLELNIFFSAYVTLSLGFTEQRKPFTSLHPLSLSLSLSGHFLSKSRVYLLTQLLSRVTWSPELVKISKCSAEQLASKITSHVIVKEWEREKWEFTLEARKREKDRQR